MAVKLCFNLMQQFADGNGVPYSGAKLFTYAAGSSTKQTTYTESTGVTPNTNPIVLDSAGRIPQPVWLTTGLSYKLVLAPSTDSDPPVSPIWTLDNVTGINDSSTTLDQWINPGLTPTFVSTTSFTLSGDQTTAFHVGRRVKTTNSGGTIYSRISASVFGALTTVTVVNDAGVLDSGLSAVSYGILTALTPSVPVLKDSNFLLSGSSDQTKLVAFEVDGLTTGTTRTLTVADKSGTLALVGDPASLGGAQMGASNTFINGTLLHSRSANAETIAVKTLAGTDPSATDPVYVVFRDQAITTGGYVVRTITAALSLTLSSGSTMGALSSVAFRLWHVLFDDAGTVRLGAVNCQSVTGASVDAVHIDVASIFPLSGWGVASSTAEGGAGAADSAQVLYTGTAVSAKPYTVIGYSNWESGLGTAGTWNTAPSRVQLFGPGVPLPGTVLQIQRSASGAVATGTTTVPLDDTLPQSGEGDQYMTVAMIPSSNCNLIRSLAKANFGTTASSTMAVSLYKDATANAFATTSFQFAATVGVGNFVIPGALHLSQTTSSTTLKLRAGCSGAGTTTFNGSASARLYGGAYDSYIEQQEIMG